MFHLGAFYESLDSAAALSQIDAVTDQAIFTSGKDMRVPTGLANLLAEAALSAQTGPDFAQVQSPTLRELANQDVMPIVNGVVFGSNDQMQDHSDNPRGVTEAESINFAVEATGGAAAANYGLIWLGDGPIKPTTGKIFSMRATAAITLAAGSWVNGALTFEDTLPAGTYDVVGLYAEGANLVAARLSFVGGKFRPGVLANSATGANRFPRFRFGRWGTFGQFDVNQPPTVDALGVTDTAQNLVLDLIKVK